MLKNEMIEKFQCPGCIHGYDTDCGNFELYQYKNKEFHCNSHVAGTFVNFNKIYIGLINGFNKVGQLPDNINNNIWICNENIPDFDEFNIPVWYRIEKDVMYIRVYSPRINYGKIFIIDNKILINNSINLMNAIESPHPDTID